MGIEPTLLAWEAKVLPLNYTRGSNNGSGAYCNGAKAALSKIQGFHNSRPQRPCSPPLAGRI